MSRLVDKFIPFQILLNIGVLIGLHNIPIQFLNRFVQQLIDVILFVYNVFNLLKIIKLQVIDINNNI